MIRMRSNKKLVILICIIVVLAISLFTYYSFDITGKSILNFIKSNSAKSGTMQQVMLTKENFPIYLESQQMIKDIPKDGVFLVKLYNFNNGEKNWEDSYVIRRSSVKRESVDNPDIIIYIDSKYIPTNDLCQTFKKALDNGDLSYELKLNQVALLWKYKNMIKYRACFGF